MTTLAFPSTAHGGTSHDLRNRVAAWWAARRDALAQGRARRVTAAELSQLDARTLRDIGLTRDDVPGTAAALVRDLALQLSLR